MTPRIRAYLMLIVVGVIWGVASPVIKYTLAGFSPTIFLTYRFGISTIIAVIIFATYGMHIPKNIGVFLTLLLYGFLNSVVSLGLLFFGMENTTVLETGLITLASPLIISTVGVYFLHEHVTKREKIGMGIAIFGTALTITGPLNFSGNLLVLGYVISTVITTLLAKNLLKKDVNPMTMTNISFIIGFICFAGYVLFNFGLLHTTYYILHTAPAYHLGVLYMAIVSGTLAFYLNTKAQKSIEIGEASLFSYLYPIFSLPIAVLWLGEKITPMFIIGAVIIAIGVAIAEIKKKRYTT
jgi:drug/metabolite transporter (DMT)-like permease